MSDATESFAEGSQGSRRPHHCQTRGPSRRWGILLLLAGLPLAREPARTADRSWLGAPHGQCPGIILALNKDAIVPCHPVRKLSGDLAPAQGAFVRQGVFDPSDKTIQDAA